MGDPFFGRAFVDVDEWRDGPVRHRYVHGGFEGTDLRFSLYFPPAERYEGRFFQPLMPISTNGHPASTRRRATRQFWPKPSPYSRRRSSGSA